MKMNASAEPEKQTQYKANTKPIQSQYKPNSRKAKMNVTSILTKDYENIANWNLVKTKPIQTQYKANTNPKQTQFPKSQNEHNFYFNKGL
jgi:hypothetical protein